jgi:hypothetical protein
MEGETPFWHKSHPYSFRLYTFYDEQVFPFVSDFIDQQRHINRLIMLQDFVVRASAKGVLLVPEDCIADGMNMDDVAEVWGRFDGVLAVKSKSGGQLPKQIIANSHNPGVTEMVALQSKLLEEISGVQGALQGKAPTAGTPASLYMQQVQNSTTSLTEIFETYRELREERDNKNMKLIQQFYTEEKFINIVGKGTDRKSMVYDPISVRNSEFDISITESSSAPAFRMVMNDFLMQIYNTGQITLLDLLENGSFPFADKLIESVKRHQQQMQAGIQPTQPLVPDDIQGQLTAGAHPLVQQILNSNNPMR